jgi:Replication-relaxation
MTLAHTLGTNDVFVAFAVAGRTATQQGADEGLEEWRGAAACERRHCKPDGYGVYRRGTARFGFFVEYDRGTERAAHYAAKFDAYCAYRETGEASRDYDGFPTLLFVTTDDHAEPRSPNRRCAPSIAVGARPFRCLSRPPVESRTTASAFWGHSGDRPADLN